MAARACEFMSYVIAKAIAAADPVSVAHQPAGAATGLSGAGAFLAATAEEFLAMTGAQVRLVYPPPHTHTHTHHPPTSIASRSLTV